MYFGDLSLDILKFENYKLCFIIQLSLLMVGKIYNTALQKGEISKKKKNTNPK